MRHAFKSLVRNIVGIIMQVNLKSDVNHIQEYHVQDPSSNAMTEVALGLCMAFFSLLVLALISIGLPSAIDIQEEQQSAAQKLLQISKMRLLAQSSQNEQKPETAKQTQIVIYWAGMFMDTNKKILSSESLAEMENVVIAVDPQISFTQLLALQQSVAGKHMQLTTLSDEWINSFAP